MTHLGDSQTFRQAALAVQPVGLLSNDAGDYGNERRYPDKHERDAYCEGRCVHSVALRWRNLIEWGGP